MALTAMTALGHPFTPRRHPGTGHLWEGRCPVCRHHEFGVIENADGHVWTYCRTGCSSQAIVALLTTDPAVLRERARADRWEQFARRLIELYIA